VFSDQGLQRTLLLYMFSVSDLSDFVGQILFFLICQEGISGSFGFFAKICDRV
jgi:hypothetical protein